MKVNEIFTSIDGEVNRWGQGVPTTFIRLQGCNFRCSYCDTTSAKIAYEDDEFPDTPIAGIIDTVLEIGCRKITITGGEPLMQPEIWALIDSLLYKKFLVSVETNGSYRIMSNFLNRKNLNWVVDYKWESSKQMRVEYTTLSKTDWIKFLVSEDNVMGIFSKIKEMRKEGVYARIAVSAVGLEHKELMSRLIKEKMFDVSLNVQLHKLINVA
jgi:7-carboxy-7-deazaguanine synthase|tara:strand:+ start:671 stop:1306 length:636 start_codon:yes stop_codon:yes gene_type:complete